MAKHIEQQLSEAEEAFVELSMEGPIDPAVYLVHGLYKNIGRSERVKSAMRKAREARLQGDLANMAVHTMRDLMRDGPATMKFAAAKYILDAAGHGAKDQAPTDAKPMSEMSQAELLAFIDRQSAIITGDILPATISVAPDDGALPTKAPGRKPRKA